MNTILISYDLVAPGKDYTPLHNAIKAYGTWWHCLESVWIIKTSQSAGQIRDYLQQYVDQNDRLVALSVGPQWATYNLTSNCNEWLRTNLGG